MRNLTRWQWGLLGLIATAACLLRAHDLPRIFLWLDETDFFNEYLYRNPPKGLIDFAVTTRNATTNTWGWPAVIWIVCRIFGPTIGAARVPSVVVGTAAVLLLFALAWRILPATRGGRFVAAALAASLAAIAMPQMEFSQRTYPYGAVPSMAALFLLAHLSLRDALHGKAAGRELRRPSLMYTVAACAALCVHVSLGLLIAASLALLALPAAKNFRANPPMQRRGLAVLAGAMACALTMAVLLNAKNPKAGYRLYLVDYYHRPSVRSLPRLLLHAYDMATYHLNLFYNPALYWPERANWAILPLVLLLVLGWTLAAAGKFGVRAGHLARLGLLAAVIPAALSVVRIFPFGGIRQTLFLSPFLLIFAALGLGALLARRWTRIPAMLGAALYLVLWAVNLPRFYNERVVPYSADDIERVWQQNHRIPVYMRGGNERELEYTLRRHPEIGIRSAALESKPPYLLITTHYQIGNPIWFPGFPAYLAKSHYRAALVAVRPPAHPESEEHRTCLYFPPNGLWIYKVTTE